MKLESDSEDNRQFVRIYESKSFLDIWYEFPSRKFIGAMDYIVKPDYLKIDYLAVNDYEDRDIHLYENCLEEEEAHSLISSMVEYAKQKAKEQNKPKLIMDVHSNLRLYEKYFQKYGFSVTDRKSTDNGFWIETEMIMGVGET